MCTPPSKRQKATASSSSMAGNDADFRKKLARLRQGIIPHLRMDYRESIGSAWQRGTLTVLHEEDEEDDDENEALERMDSVQRKYSLQLDIEEDSRVLHEAELEVGTGLVSLGVATPCK